MSHKIMTRFVMSVSLAVAMDMDTCDSQVILSGGVDGTDGKAGETLVNRWIHLENRSGFVYFFHPQALKRPDNISVLLCQGHVPSSERWSQCEKTSGQDALSMGIVTSLDVKRSCDAGSLLAAGGRRQ
jgi:hypothetical protein